MADLRTRVSASLTPEAQARMDNAGVNFAADQAFESSISSELAKGWTSAGLGEKANSLFDEANNAYRSGDATAGRTLEAEGRRNLQLAQTWSPEVRRFSDVTDLASGAKWAMGALGNVRSSVTPAFGGLQGAVAGALLTRSAQGARIGAGLGAGVFGYDQMANETIGGAMMDPGIRANKSMQEIKDTGRVSGAVQAPLEALVPGLMGGAAMGLAKGLGRAGVKQAAAAGLAGGAVTEAGTEFAQDLVGQGAMNSLRDKPLTQDLDYKQALDSAAAGAVAGGGMGLAGGAMQGLHNRGAGAVDAVGDAVANPGSLLDKGAVLAGDAAGKIMNAAEGVGGKVKGKINSTLDEFIASRVVDPDRHSLLAPMTEEESNLSGQELVDRFKPKAQAWASKVLQNPSAYDEEDVADATEFGKTNDPFLLQSKLRNRMGAKAGGKSDEAIADELNPKVKSSKMSAENAEATKKAWDESTRLLAKIWHKQGIDDGIIQAVEGSEDDPIKQNAAVAVMSWVQRGFKGTDGEVIIPEQMIRAYGTKRAGKLIKNAYDLAVGQGVIDDTAEQTFDEVQARVKELGQGHEADVAKVIDNLTPIAREKIVNALSYRDKESAKAHASDLAKDIRSIVQAKSVGDHFGFLHELFGPKMNDVLDHFQPADAEVSSTRDVVAEERADFDANVEEGTGEEFDYDPAINEVEADIDSKTRYVVQSKTNEYFDMHNEFDRAQFEREAPKSIDADTRVSKIGLVDREIEKIEEEKGRTLPPSERFKVMKRVVEARLARPRPKEVPNLPDNATPEQKKAHEAAMEDYRAKWDEYSKLSAYKPSKLPDGAGPDQTKAHAKSVEDYERRVRSTATQLNKQYKAMRVATEKLAAPRVNFTPDQIDSIHHKNLDHRGPKATIQHGVLFFDRGGNKTPYVTTSGAILREMFQVKDGSQESTTEDFGGDAASRMQLLKQGIASLLTGGDFVRVGYVKYAGAKPTWMRSNSRLPGDLTIGRSGEKGKERPLTVREAEEQEASKFTPPMSTGHGGEVAMPKNASAETKKALNALPSDPATLGGTQYETVRAQSTKEIAFKLGELLKENGANMTKDVRGDIVKATKRFWNLEKRGEVAAGYTAERINAEVDALGLELGFDITTVRTRLEPRTNEPEKIVPSEKSLGKYESETSRREDDPKTLGPDGKAIHRDERGFIDSGNATMVAANMAGSESTVVMKVEPKQPVPKPTAKPVVQQDFSIQNVIDNLIRNVGNVVAFVRKSSESRKSVGALLEVLRTIAKMTPGQIRAFDSSLTMNGASRIKVRAENALARIERIGDELHRSDPDGNVETGAQGEVASVYDEDLRSTDMVTRTAVDPATVRRSQAVAGGAAAEKLSQASALTLLRGMVSSRNADTNLIRRILKNGDIDKSMRDELTADLAYLESIKAGSVGDSVSQKTVDGWSKMFAGGEKIIVSKVKGQFSGVTTAMNAFQTVVDGERYLVTTGGSSKEMSLSILAHEFGHALQFVIFDQASAGVKHRVTAAWKRDVEAANADPTNTSRFMSGARFSGAIDPSSVESIPPAHFPLRRLMDAVGESAYNSEHKDYVLSFEEWFAEQFSRYATSDIDANLPANVKGFWQELIGTFKKLFDMIIKPLQPNAEFKGWVDSLRENKQAGDQAVATEVRPGVKPKTSMVMRFKDGTDFAGIKHVMRDEFRGKSTMDLIMSGDRTATTRNSKPDLQVGDIVTMDDGSGTKVDVRVTKAPYQIKLFGDERDQRNAEKWSQLEGWAPEVFKAYGSKGAWQFQYERVAKAQGKGVTVVEHPSSGYRDRTKHNADSAGATVAIATDFDTAGEQLTKRLAGDKIVQIPIAKTPASAAKALIAHMQALGVTTLNVAGNGIYTLNEKLGVTQAQVNQHVYDTLKAAHLVVGITKIVTGGQTGVDIAGAIAAKRLGIPVDVTMPKGFLQRDMHGKDFTQTKEKVVAQIEDGARSLVDKGAVFEAQDAQGKGGTLSDALRSAESTEELFAAVESAAPLRLKPVLALLKSNLKMNQIKLKRTSVAGVGGQWDEVNRTLLINPDVLLKGILGMSPDESAATAITHELVHAATVSAIGDGIVVSIAPYSRRDAREKVDAIHVKLKDYVRRNFSELSDFERQIADKMLKNNKELVAWGMTDVTAQKLLSRIEGQDKRSLFQGLIDLVASVLGLKGVDSGLGDLLTVGAELISGNTKSSKAKAEGKALSMDSAEVQAAKDHILKTVGDKIGLKFIKAFMDGKSGEHRMGPAGQENVIRIALNSDVLGTAYHESIHEFFSMLTNGAATATKEVLLRAGKNKRLLREVSRLLDGHPEAQAQLSDPEEALAYIYQFWKAGALKIGPETKTMFQKVSEYFRNVLGLVSDEMREQQDLLNADKILTAFDQGAYGNETIRAGVMAAVNADVERQDAALKAVGEKWTTIVNKVGKLALPAEQVIEASGNKRLIKILRDFNQKTGDAMDGKASFFEAVSASRNKFMLRLENVMAKADKKDLELARQHLVKGTDPSDPVVTSIVLKTREVLDDLYKFAAERQVARWDSETHEWVGLEYRKGYFTQAWSLDELVKSGPAFKKDLLATHNAELQAIVDRAIKADPKLVVTVDDVAETILSRLLNSQGQVELDETTSDLGISPMASAVNRRSLDWLDKDVFDKYKEKDLVKIMSSYVSTMVKRAEYTDRFGRGGTRLRTAADEAVLEEIGGDELVNEAHTKLPKAIEAWRDQLSRGIEAAMPTLRGVGEVAFAAKKGKDVLEAARTKALKKLGPSFKAVMALEGTLGSDIKQGMRTFNSWMMTYQNVRLLSTSLFTSFSDTVGLVLNGGELGDAWDGFVRGIREIKLRWQDDKSQDLKAIRAEMWGTVDAGSSLDALGQTYGGMWMSGTARRMSDSLFKWNGMEAWNRAMRITATSVAERIIKEFKEKGFDKHDKAAVARFEELFGRGFKPEDIKLDATGELDSTDSKNQAAVSRWVNGAILRPNAAQRTVWGSDPHFQMIWHMKQFTYTFQNVILGKVIEQAKLGNYRPAMVMMAGYTPVIIAADAIKEMLIPGDEPPWMKGGLAGLIQHGVDKAGLLGIGQMGYDAMASDYGAGLTGPAVSQLLHVPMDDPSRTALGALPFGNLARRMAND